MVFGPVRGSRRRIQNALAPPRHEIYPRVLIRDIANKSGSPYEEARASIREIRTKVREGKYPEALTAATGLDSKLREQLDAAVAQGRHPTTEAFTTAHRAMRIREELGGAARVTEQTYGIFTKTVGRARGWLALRTRQLSPVAWGWARSVVRWGTALVLLYVGFNTLYLKDPTFGNDGLVDYLALVAWGLGSDVASRLATVLTGAAAAAAG